MVTCRLGKPHSEQGQIGPAPLCRERPALVLLTGQAGRVGCLSPAVTSGLEEWPSGRVARSGRTGSGLQTDFGYINRVKQLSRFYRTVSECNIILVCNLIPREER